MTERHYPLALKIAVVALLAFDIVILYHNLSVSSIFFWFSIVFFLAILNSWAAAENDDFIYGDVFLLNDASCTGLFFLILLELYNNTYQNVLLFSGLIFTLYYLWNRLLISMNYVEKDDLINFQRSNVMAAGYSFFAWCIIQWVEISPFFVELFNIVEIITWFLLLFVWYKETYTKDNNRNVLK